MTRIITVLLCLGLALAAPLISGCSTESKKDLTKNTPKTTDKSAQQAAKEAEEQRQKELDEARLDEEKQEFIFESEHVTFVIERVLGVDWKKAFKESDSTRLRQFLFDEFAGSTLSEIPLDTLTASVVTQKTRTRPTSKDDDGIAAPENGIDADGLVKYLVEIRNQFSSIERVKFRVLKISQPIAGQPVWSCRILLDVVGESQPEHPKQFESEQTVVFEIANESEITSRPTISEWVVEKETFRDSEQYLTKEVTKESLISDVQLANNWELDVKHTEQYWFQYSVEDFDRDGKLDVAVSCNMFYPRLFYNAKGNRFIDVADERRLSAAGGKVRIGTSFGCAWLDFNNDGYPDLINGLSLFQSNEGKSFTDIYARSGLVFHSECMGIIVADYDCDGLVDIYALYQSPPIEDGNVAKQWVNETMSGAENQLWKNVGNGRFINVTKKANAGGGKRHTHAANWFFYDDDRYPDLYIANDFGKNVLLRNKGDGTFEDISAETQTAGYSTSMGVSTGDLNNDGINEIYVANMYSKMGRRIIGQVGDSDYPEGIFDQIKGSCAGNRLYTREAGKEFKEIGEDIGIHDVGWAFGPSFADFDGNGLLDIYATTGFMSFQRDKPDG